MRTLLRLHRRPVATLSRSFHEEYIRLALRGSISQAPVPQSSHLPPRKGQLTDFDPSLIFSSISWNDRTTGIFPQKILSLRVVKVEVVAFLVLAVRVPHIAHFLLEFLRVRERHPAHTDGLQGPVDPLDDFLGPRLEAANSSAPSVGGSV